MPEARLTVQQALAAYRGDRSEGALEWGLDPPWRLGSEHVVLFAGDPAEWAAGERGRAHVRGVLSRGRWVVPPDPDLFREGVIHED